MESLTTREVAVLLGKSERAVSRYVKKGLLTAHKVKNEEGRIENRFNEEEVRGLKEKQTQDTMTDTTKDSQTGDVIVGILQERVKEQTEQLRQKDIQIERLQSNQESKDQNNIVSILQKELSSKDRIIESLQKDKEQINVLLQQSLQQAQVAALPDRQTQDTKINDEWQDTQADNTTQDTGVSEVQNKRKWYFLWLFR